MRLHAVVTETGRYPAIDRPPVLAELRRATLARTGERQTPVTGMLPRGGPRQVEETRRLWATWTELR